MSEGIWILVRDLGQSAIALVVLAWLTREILKHWLAKDVSSFKEELAHQNRLAIEQGKWRNELRLAALDHRLKVHQEAYDLWYRLRINLSDVDDEEWERDDERLWGVVEKCQDWWPRNCLYLSAEARGAFHACIRAAVYRTTLLNYYESMMQHDKDGKEKAKAAVRKNTETIDGTGEAIVKGADLPSLGEEEFMATAKRASARTSGPWNGEA